MSGRKKRNKIRRARWGLGIGDCAVNGNDVFEKCHRIPPHLLRYAIPFRHAPNGDIYGASAHQIKNYFLANGPVDTFWIENLNTVLDDSKLLTLAIGDRVSMPPSVRICFEVEHSNHAPPATVSRAGIICVSEEEWVKTKRGVTSHWTFTSATAARYTIS